ncbi:hypothetical protein QTP70_030035, partial [Hemibagrus guttatus]
MHTWTHTNLPTTAIGAQMMQSPQCCNNTHARVLFVDFSSAFNTVTPSKLTTKLGGLGIDTSLRNCIMDFLTNRSQHIRPVYGPNSIIKFADDTTVIGLISDNEVQHLVAWCVDDNLLLNTSKTKELIVDFRREKGRTHDPIHINGMAVECVSSFKFLGTHISEDLSWTTDTSSLVKKAHQRIFYLNTLKKNHLSSTILVKFYCCVIESILTNCIAVWYGNCSVADRKALQREVKTAQSIIGTPLPAIEDIQKKRC